ncbi:MAG TPA: heavy metal-binding domain-containing protein, partial [Fibrobacteria bacterium]|nr:heavy metal-binding domain-containing protein [Fibrobacteria bacterium]
MSRILFSMILALTVFVGCKGTPQADASHAPVQDGSHGHAWRCPMHPQVVRDKEGTCPICGMDLVAFAPEVAKSPDSGSSTYMEAGKAVSVSPSVLQKIGVRTEMVDNGTVGREVVADAEGVLDKASEVS